MHANDAQGNHLPTKVRMTSRHREGTLVPGAKASHAPTVRARPYIPRREEAPPDRRHSHCHSRISRGITDASSVVAGLMSCNGAVPVADGSPGKNARPSRHERALASVTVLDGVGLDARRNADSKA